MELSDISISQCGSSQVRISECGAGLSNVTLSNLEISGNQAANGSGIIRVSGPCNLALSGSRLVGNAGRALHVNGGASAVVTDCSFDRNSWEDGGGGISMDEGNLRAVNCSFFGNFAGQGKGGAIHAQVGPFLFLDFFGGSQFVIG